MLWLPRNLPTYEGDNHHSFPHMTLLNSTMLRQPLLIQTGALMSPLRNSTVQMAAVATNKTQVSLTVGLESYTSTKKRTISENSMRCNKLKSINLEWRIIERSDARHLGFILTTTNSEGDFPIDVCRGYNTSPSTAAHSSSPESNSQCHTQFHSLTIPAPPFPLVQDCVHHTRTQTKGAKG